MCFDTSVEVSKLLQTVMRGIYSYVAQMPKERGLIGMLEANIKNYAFRYTGYLTSPPGLALRTCVIGPLEM